MVTADQIKQLRALTQAPIKDCKDALVQSQGDIEAAQQLLRDQGAAKAAKKSDRETTEGTVVIKKINSRIIGLKFLCETDFVAKNETFKSLADLIVQEISKNTKSIVTYEDLDEEVKTTIAKHITDNVLTIGENMQIGSVIVSDQNGYIYTHPGDKVASIVFYEGEEVCAKKIALQVSAMNPLYLSVDDVSQDVIEQLTQEAQEDMKDSGKPQDIVEKIIAGKVSKILADDVLMEQESIIDGSKKVKDTLGSTKIFSYVRYSVK